MPHKECNKVRAAYNRAQRLDERRVMMQAWSDHLDSLRDGANVSRLRRGDRLILCVARVPIERLRRCIAMAALESVHICTYIKLQG
jgi:hypothetical protein